MKYAFITGIPAAGKSTLARKIADAMSIQYIAIDAWRREMKKDSKLSKWVNFFWNQDEKMYWRNINYEQHMENLKNQSEAFWHNVLFKIKEIQKFDKGAIFEGVNILPHLAKKDLDFGGIALLGESFEQILERNIQDPRWGRTEELITAQAKAFWNWERPWYKNEAERCGYKAFSDANLAESELLKLLGK